MKVWMEVAIYKKLPNGKLKTTWFGVYAAKENIKKVYLACPKKFLNQRKEK